MQHNGIKVSSSSSLHDYCNTASSHFLSMNQELQEPSQIWERHKNSSFCSIIIQVTPFEWAVAKETEKD